jgi:hypothetical protein
MLSGYATLSRPMYRTSRVAWQIWSWHPQRPGGPLLKPQLMPVSNRNGTLILIGLTLSDNSLSHLWKSSRAVRASRLVTIRIAAGNYKNL